MLELAAGLLLLASPVVPDAEIRAGAERVQASVVATRRDLHQHPELSNREERTGKLVAERLKVLGLEVRYPVAKTGVVGILRGGRRGPAVALRADIDALPMDEVNAVPYKSQNPGVMHSCGHDAHTAVLLGVAEVLSGLKARLPGTVVFLFQPAEEGAPEGEEGGAPLMIKEGALDDPKPVAVFGLHVGLQLANGKVGLRSGPFMASSDAFTIEIAGKRVHGSTPHLGIDPIPVAATMVGAVQAIVSRETDTQEPRVLSIGKIQGGTRNNIIADQVEMQGTLRTFSDALRADIKARLARTVKGVAEAHGTTATLRFHDRGNPATANDPALTEQVRPALERALGPGVLIDPGRRMGAEDFTFYSAKAPTVFLFLGVENPTKGIRSVNHSPDFDVDEDVLPIGVRALATMAWDTLARATH